MKRDGLLILIIGLLSVVAIAAFFIRSDKSAPISSSAAWRNSAPSRGSTTPKVKIVEFGDFQCPTCKAFVPILDKILAENKDVSIQYRYLPLPEHGNAREAAVAAEYAHRQGKFWEMYALLYSNQDSWASNVNPKEIFTQFLVLLGINESNYQQDIDRTSIEQLIDADVSFANQNQLLGTPSFFINGTVYSGALTEVALNDAIIKASSNP